MDKDKAAELRVKLETAERNLRFANLRAQWLERRLLEAPSEQEFEMLLAELESAEKTVTALGLELIRTRAAWAQADDAARAAEQ